MLTVKPLNMPNYLTVAEFDKWLTDFNVIGFAPIRQFIADIKLPVGNNIVVSFPTKIPADDEYGTLTVDEVKEKIIKKWLSGKKFEAVRDRLSPWHREDEEPWRYSDKLFDVLDGISSKGEFIQQAEKIAGLIRDMYDNSVGEDEVIEVCILPIDPITGIPYDPETGKPVTHRTRPVNLDHPSY